jgi:tetratricopeptide (TPR) repeat protein
MDVGSAFPMALGMAIVGMLLSIPVGLIIKAWLVDGTLEGGFALGAILILMILFGLTWTSQGSGMMLLFLFLLLTASFGLPILGSRWEKKAQKQLDDGDIQKFRAAIERDPKNASAYAFLGDALIKRGSYVAAQAQYEKAVELAPQAEAWQRKLRDVRMQVERQTLGTSGPSMRVLVCTNCRADNDAALSRCARCNTPLPGTAQEFLENRDQQKEILKASSAAGLMAAGCMAVFTSLPLEWKGCVLMASALYFGWVWMKDFGK